jgi:hypothetical protein
MLDRIRLNIKYYLDQPRPGNLADFLNAIRYWWHNRPQLTHCSFCGQRIWWNGPRVPNSPDEEKYCSEGCAFYGPHEDYPDEVIPF